MKKSLITNIKQIAIFAVCVIPIFVVGTWTFDWKWKVATGIFIACVYAFTSKEE